MASPYSIVTDLAVVRQLISENVSDDILRRQLLQLAGASPQTWMGCSRMDVLAVLKLELAQQQRAGGMPMPTQAPAPPCMSTLANKIIEMLNPAWARSLH
jgi:hypothetical protein